MPAGVRILSPAFTLRRLRVKIVESRPKGLQLSEILVSAKSKWLTSYFTLGIKMISKTRIEKRLKKKTNTRLVGALIKLKKKNPVVGKILVGPVKKSLRVNLKDIEKKAGGATKILVPGKVLSSGELTKKIKVVAWGASEKAREKMKKSGVEFVLLEEEIKKNPELKDLKIIK